MKLYQEEYIKNLPDSYRKDKDSNNCKLLELAKYSVEDLRKTLQQLVDSLDLNNATGKTLDLYGEMLGQNRGLSTDEQYRMLIKTRIMRNLSNGSNKSVVNSLAAILNCNSSEISIQDTENKTCSVSISSIPLETVLLAGMSTKQFEALIKTLMPVGVTFEQFAYDGTFTFSDLENEYNETEGFSDVEEGTIGGYLGVLSGDENGVILPTT